MDTINKTNSDALKDRLAVQLAANGGAYRNQDGHIFFYYIWRNKLGSNRTETRSAWSSDIDNLAATHKLIDCQGDIPILQAI